MLLMRLLVLLLVSGAGHPGVGAAAPDAVNCFHLYAPRAGTVVVKPVAGGSTVWHAVPMIKDPAARGYWNATVVGMRPGDGYVFTIDGADRIDPSCLDISPDSSHSVVPLPYTWLNPRRVVPPRSSIFYEMQVGSFTAQGTLTSAMTKLSYLAQLGITVIELMPVMHFCGDADSWLLHAAIPPQLVSNNNCL